MISAYCKVHYYHCFEDEWNRMTLAEVGASLVPRNGFNLRRMHVAQYSHSSGPK